MSVTVYAFGFISELGCSIYSTRTIANGQRSKYSTPLLYIGSELDIRRPFLTFGVVVFQSVMDTGVQNKII